MQKLSTAMIQTELAWENTDKNLDRFTEKIHSVKPQVDLIILPEMFTTGFTMQPGKVAETMDGKTVTWMRETARKSKSAITGSVVIKENGRFLTACFLSNRTEP